MRMVKQLNGSLLCFVVIVGVNVSVTTCQCSPNTDLERYHRAKKLYHASEKREFSTRDKYVSYEENIYQTPNDPFLKGIVCVLPDLPIGIKQ